MNNTDLFQNYFGKINPEYFINTYGCQMNDHEAEKIAFMLGSMGCTESASQENADIIVFNTCCVRDTAERKIEGHIGLVKQLKKNKSHKIVVVCGCMTQQNNVAQRLKKKFGFIDIIIGTHNLTCLEKYIQTRISTGKKIIDISTDDKDVPYEVISSANGAVASVNIMYGCNNFCSYCIVPYVRGRERSRKKEDIISEINLHIKNGVKEILLLGQNVNSYGKEYGMSFAGLLESICSETDIQRIRFMTSHPKDISDDLIRVIASYNQICKHIHLPVQSGSTRILAEMNRKYSREDYLALVNNIRSRIKNVAITTDIIVGFPGETDDDFMDTMSLVENVRFDAAYTFVYSVRTGTKAAEMYPQISEEVKRDRITRLIALQNQITEEVDKSYEGTVQKVLVESLSTRDEKHLCGRCDSGKTVNFPGNSDKIGTFCNVMISEGKRTTLFGEEVR